MNRIFDITAFGAVDDGVTDSTKAIQTALDAAGKVGGTVIVPPGRFVCGSLNVPAGIAITGDHAWGYGRDLGGSVLILRSAEDACLMNLSYSFGTTVKGITMEGRRLGENIHGVFVSYEDYGKGGMEDCTRMEDCMIAGFSGDGVHYQCFWCISIRHCMFTGNSGYGLFLDGWDGFILDNWFSGNGWGGIGCEKTCSSVTFTGNRIECNGGPGITLHMSKCCNLTGNYFDCSGGPSISIRGGAGEAVADTITITGNIFTGSGSVDFRSTEVDPLDNTHIRIERCVNAVVMGNAFRARVELFKENKGELRPTYAFVIRQLRGCIIRDNVMQSGMRTSPLLDLGEHEDTIIYTENIGRPTRELTPWFPVFENDSKEENEPKEKE